METMKWKRARKGVDDGDDEDDGDDDRGKGQIHRVRDLLYLPDCIGPLDTSERPYKERGAMTETRESCPREKRPRPQPDNVVVSIEGNRLVVVCDLAVAGTFSRSRKSTLLATTRGAMEIAPDGDSSLCLNLNLYRRHKDERDER